MSKNSENNLSLLTTSIIKSRSTRNHFMFTHQVSREKDISFSLYEKGNFWCYKIAIYMIFFLFTHACIFLKKTGEWT
jgi:hypothetical protein